MSRMIALTHAACGVALAVLASFALGADADGQDCARRYYIDPQLTSEEFDEGGVLGREKYVVHFLPGQHKEKEKGGTLRLGAYQCQLTKGTKAAAAYGSDVVSERHRHRYEFNNSFKDKLEQAGLIFSGTWAETGLAEIVEVRDHPFMLGTQYHPEFLSRPHRPHPLFAAFIKAAMMQKNSSV